MSNSRTITIKNPSRKLEEKIRDAGVQKYLWLKELCSEDTKPNKVTKNMVVIGLNGSKMTAYKKTFHA